MIRDRYPLYDEGPRVGIQVELPPDVEKVLSEQIKALDSKRSFNFLTEDGHWKVGLTQEFLALSTTDYSTWEDFLRHFDTPFAALAQSYKPAFISRVGLRYRDVIRRSKLELDGVPWSKLITPTFAAELSDPVLGDAVRLAKRQVQLELPDKAGSVMVRHGLVTDGPDGEECFVFDADFFTTDRTEIDDAISKLNHFNSLSGSLFRYSISDTLREALQPREP
jgi:uncharacterized protein (TIGR04255 family)